MTKPVRLRLSRAKGFDLQVHSLVTNGLPAVNVGRPSQFGNPFRIGGGVDRDRAVELFDYLIGGYICLSSGPTVEQQRNSQAAIVTNMRDLTGKNLACWCRLDQRCHADTLLEIANNKKKLKVCDRFKRESAARKAMP